jgi:hypothetical protein
MTDHEGDAEGSGDTGTSGVLAAAGLIVGLYAMAPGFYLDGLHVKRGAEVVDHVVPGLAILVLVFAAIMWGQRVPALPLFSGAGILLAGVWMTDTHIGLVRQAFDGQAPGGATAYHASTAFVVDVLAVAWLWRHRRAGAAHR